MLAAKAATLPHVPATSTAEAMLGLDPTTPLALLEGLPSGPPPPDRLGSDAAWH